MRYLSICSGIEAATAAWHPLGWTPAAFSEIEKFPRAVLAHHYPDVPLHGDFTTIGSDEYGPIDLLVGGTPCQSFSIAGLRGGLDDDRGNLALEFCRLAQRTRPRWVVWENVPGVLSMDGGRAFASILGGLAECGYGLAYRVLDAQYVRVDGFARAVPQRRRRVFVVGYFGDWRRAAAVLFEPEGLRRDSPPRRKTWKDVAPTISARTQGGGGLGTDFDCDGGLIASNIDRVAPTLDANFGKLQGASGQDLNHGHGHLVAFGGNNQSGPIDVATAQTAHGGAGRFDFESETFVAHALRAEGFDASEDGTGRGTPLVPIAFSCKDYGNDAMADIAPTMRAMGHDGSHANAGGQSALAFNARQDPDVFNGHTGPLDTHGLTQAVLHSGENNASPSQANSGALLRGVREALGEKAFAEWGLGILDTLQPAEILRSALHGSELRPASFSRRWVVCCTLGSPVSGAEGAVQSMREAGCSGRSPQGWQPSEQRSRELGTYLSELSQPGAQAERFMRDLWLASEGSELLRQTLSAVQAARRSSRHKDTAEAGMPLRGASEREGAVREALYADEATWRVRRLLVEECEFLHGFPRGYSAIPYRGKPAADGPRYKALGNSFAVNVVRWIGQRIQIVEDISNA